MVDNLNITPSSDLFNYTIEVTEVNQPIFKSLDISIKSLEFASYYYLRYIHSLLDPYRNMKTKKNILNKSNIIYKPSKLSICYSREDLYNLKKQEEEENKIYFLIYYDENFEKDF